MTEDGMVGWLDGITNSMDMNLSKFWEMVKDRKAWRAAVHGVEKTRTRERLKNKCAVHTAPHFPFCDHAWSSQPTWSSLFFRGHFREAKLPLPGHTADWWGAGVDSISPSDQKNHSSLDKG